jgi:hypothetical protein
MSLGSPSGSTGFVQLGEKLGPLVVKHGFQALSGHVTRAGAVEIVTDLLVVSGDGLGNGAGSGSDHQEPARDFLAGTDFGEGTEGGWIEIQRQCFAVSVEFFSGWDGQNSSRRCS